MLEVDLILQADVEASISAATDRYLMRVVGDSRRPVLRISVLQGRVLSLGRYHLAPPMVANSTVQLTRSQCGGRVRASGQGFLTVSLFLPHRSALVSTDPFALAPVQVLNRFVRGILQMCRELGIPAYYPGRDLVTVDRAVFAMISFECAGSGTTLLEAHVATSGELATVADLLETADPNGLVTAELWSPGATTSLDRRLGRSVDVEEMASLICRGYQSQFPIVFHHSTLSSGETDAIRTDATSTTQSWIASRCSQPGANRHAIFPVQLGIVEAYFSIDDNDRIESVVFAGDFIANSPAVEALEKRLRGCPLRADAIDRIVKEVFDGKENFILGVGRLDAISRLLTVRGSR